MLLLSRGIIIIGHTLIRVILRCLYLIDILIIAPSLSSECAVRMCGSTGVVLDCNNRFTFKVNYYKENCCNPGCYNGGICLTTGVCSCPTGYPLPSCRTNCSGVIASVSNAGISLPLGYSHLCPSQEYRAAQTGYVSSITLGIGEQ